MADAANELRLLRVAADLGARRGYLPGVARAMPMGEDVGMAGLSR